MTLKEAIEWFEKNGGGWGTDTFLNAQEMIEYLEELSQLREEKRATGFQNGYDRGYAAGMTKAWDIARMLNPDELSLEDVEEIFGTDNCAKIIKERFPLEVERFINEWREAKEIHVGDIVKTDFYSLCVATRVHENNITVLWKDGSTGRLDAKRLTKTGRRIDVESVLKQIGREEQ